MEWDRGCARIKVVGAGGAGGNAVDRMISSPLEGVEFIAVNTDLQALDCCRADVRVTTDARMRGEMRLTLVATGFHRRQPPGGEPPWPSGVPSFRPSGRRADRCPGLAGRSPIPPRPRRAP
jgi:cell division GTPase FtsZ